MVDIETLDSSNDALILSIGAKEFDPELDLAGWQGRELYVVAKQDLQVSKWKRTTSEATKKWWSEQSEEARKVLADPSAVMLDTALGAFAEWLAGQHVQVWGYGSTFDNVILRSAYRAVGMPCPWGHREDMCYRTLASIVRGMLEVPERTGTHHNALDDARYQARCATLALKRLGVK
jgi:exodeoxyribonuclease VIII